MDVCLHCLICSYQRSCALATGWVAALLLLSSPFLAAQSADTERPVPILTGNAGFFTNVDGGEKALVPEINPVLLLPLGDRWLIESRAGFEGEFERTEWGTGPYGGKVEKEIDFKISGTLDPKTNTIHVLKIEED